MRIGIDAHYLGFRQSGNETYVRNVLEALAAIDGSNVYRVYVADRGVAENPPVVSPCLEYAFVHRSPLVRIPFGIPWELSRRPVDVLQAHYNAPPIVPCKLLLVIHDISWAVMPHLFPYLKGRQIALRARVGVRQAERIVVPTDVMKQEVLGFYDLPDERVAVIPLGVDGGYNRESAESGAERVAATYDIHGPFILYVGDMQPRKNLPRLVEAFAVLKQRGIPHKLVIAGKKAWGYDDIFATVERLGLGEEVLFPGYVPDEDLPGLYGAADLFVYPSIYEGFGLPPLEAMACGTVVAASRAPTLESQLGGAAVLFDPSDAEGIAETMMTALSDEEVRRRSRDKGFSHAKTLTWEACAGKLLTLYAEIGSS